MGDAKGIVLRPIERREADQLIKRVHYSGKVVNNSQVHFGVFYQGRLEGAMQFGPSLDKRKLVNLVDGTLWNEFIELNRLAFTEALPRNSESRALGVAMRVLRKHAPHLKWVVTFADGTQCGDGTIYRAAGFVLTAIKKNTQIWEAPLGGTMCRLVGEKTQGSRRTQLLAQLGQAGTRESRTSLTDGRSKLQQDAARHIVSRVSVTKGHDVTRGGGGASMRQFKEAGFRPLPGFQLRYLYFLDPTAKERLTVPIIPYSQIARRGAMMVRGARVASIQADAPEHHSGEGGAAPTATLQLSGRHSP